jgi:hypothetical protein
LNIFDRGEAFWVVLRITDILHRSHNQYVQNHCSNEKAWLEEQLK